MKKSKKIYVLGHSGAGTTTLASQLSKKLKIPHYDFDNVMFIKKFTKTRTKLQRKKLVNKLLKKKKWIIDARGTDWDQHAMHDADLIVWLITPTYKRIFRIFKRYFTRKGDKEFEESFIGMLECIKYALNFRYGKMNSSFNKINEFLKKHNLHPIIIKNNRQLKEFLETLK